MEQYTRTEHSVKNAYITTISRAVAILMGFATRVVFTHTLSENYVGVNGLFTDILNVLSLSELGIEAAITYALYRPIAENNIEEQKSLMRIYRWYYRMVASIVAVFGLALLPFMDVLIKNKPEVEHLTVIYLLYLMNSVLSYLLIYKKTLIDAHQMLYIGILYQTAFWVVMDALQMITLITTKNFILYLLIHSLCTLGINLCISRKADRLYPYLRDKNIKPLGKEKKQQIFKNVKAMLFHKIGTVALNNTDNLILSSMIGITATGIYSNYFLIIQSINQILSQMFQGITASVGNLGVSKEPHRVKSVYETAFFISHWVYGVGAICLFELLNPFVKLSFGENYLFSRDIVLILCINFFILGMKDATLVFRDSLGLFWYDRYISLACAAINIVISIVLTRQYQTIGVFLGTLASILLTSAWLEPYLLYKNFLKQPYRPYLTQYIRYLLSVGGIWCLTDYLCGLTGDTSLSSMLMRLLLCVTVPNIILIVLNYRKKEFRIAVAKASIVLKGLRGRLFLSNKK